MWDVASSIFGQPMTGAPPAPVFPSLTLHASAAQLMTEIRSFPFVERHRTGTCQNEHRGIQPARGSARSTHGSRPLVQAGRAAVTFTKRRAAALARHPAVGRWSNGAAGMAEGCSAHSSHPELPLCRANSGRAPHEGEHNALLHPSIQ